jgi:uncharacterized protein YbaA (DUF1428 family)
LPRAVQAKEDEVVVLPFDGKRMIYGGFRPFLL